LALWPADGRETPSFGFRRRLFTKDAFYFKKEGVFFQKTLVFSQKTPYFPKRARFLGLRRRLNPKDRSFRIIRGGLLALNLVSSRKVVGKTRCAWRERRGVDLPQRVLSLPTAGWS
jgi:hypothetical protein